jgi:site-specific recombinase XerD
MSQEVSLQLWAYSLHTANTSQLTNFRHSLLNELSVVDRPLCCVEVVVKQPYSPDAILKRSIRPGATRAKIAKRIGWHTFRRTFSTLLKATGEDVKVVQELLRHASAKITLDVYAQAVTPDKRSREWRRCYGREGRRRRNPYWTLLDPRPSPRKL